MRIQFETSELRKKIRKLIQVAPRLGRQALARAGAYHVREMGKRFVPYGSGSASGFGGSIQRRSGALINSFKFQLEDSGGSPRVVMFTDSTAYARKQEFGGTIVPVRRKFLTVPLPPALTASGVLKGGARLVERGDDYYTADGKRTAIFGDPNVSAIIAAVNPGRRGTITPLYALKRSVRLRPRLGFMKTFREKTQPFFHSDLSRLLREAMGS